MGTTTRSTESPAGQVRLRYWASVRAAAGVEEDVLDVEGAVTLDTLRDRVRRLHEDSDRFAAVLATCSVLVGDRPVGAQRPEAVHVRPGQTVEFLPPFAGG